jgi:hypothetical protein
MPFLHFKAHGFCMKILFYDFCIDFIEICDIGSLWSMQVWWTLCISLDNMLEKVLWDKCSNVDFWNWKTCWTIISCSNNGKCAHARGGKQFSTIVEKKEILWLTLMLVGSCYLQVKVKVLG